MRSTSSCKRRARGEQGSALIDFALVSVVLVPLFFGVLQLALIWHVKTTLTASASEGARYGAAYNRTASDGAERTQQAIDDSLGGGVRDTVSANESVTGGQQIVEVEVTAQVPVLAFWGPTIELEVSGHAVKEVLP